TPSWALQKTAIICNKGRQCKACTAQASLQHFSQSERGSVLVDTTNSYRSGYRFSSPEGVPWKNKTGTSTLLMPCLVRYSGCDNSLLGRHSHKYIDTESCCPALSS